MRIAYDITGLEVDQSGAARSIAALRETLRSDPRVELIEIAQPASRPRLRRLRGFERELAWYPVGLPTRLRASGADLLHCPGPLGPPRRVGVPFVLTLNDVMPLDHPEWFTRVNVLHTRTVVRRLATLADAILVPSRFSARELTAAWGIDPARIHLTPYGVDPRFTPGPVDGAALERLGVRRPYLLTVGRLQPRKNLEAAIDAFARLSDAGAEHQLVVAGARGWHDDELLTRVGDSPAAGRIRVTGRITDEELIALYRGADCFVFPSRFEGFGFPPLEAMACGAPVVSSNSASLPEVVSDAGLVVDPGDVAGMAAAIEGVLADPPRREHLRQAGLERAGAFTWQACADATIAAYEAALGV